MEAMSYPDNGIEDYYRNNFSKKIKTISRILKGDFPVAEDIVQEAFVRAIKFQRSYDPTIGTLDKWFNSIMFNCLREYQSDPNHRKMNNYGDINPEEVLNDWSMSDDKSRKILIPKHIMSLDNDFHKRILTLFFILGYTSSEICQIENDVTVSNVTTVVSRFKEKLHNREV